MMNAILKNLVIFAALAVLFSFLSGCGGSSTSDPGQLPDGETTGNGLSEFPKLADSLANAEMKSIDGSVLKVSDRKGKVLLLNLWATWCGPCRQEMPLLVELQDEHRDKGFEVIGLNVDNEQEDMVRDFAAEMKLNYALVWPDELLTLGLMKLARGNEIPQSFIIDRDGRLRNIFKGINPQSLAKLKQTVEKTVNE
jgi:thiol-disulfide isomerase/thioredoxin